MSKSIVEASVEDRLSKLESRVKVLEKAIADVERECEDCWQSESVDAVTLAHNIFCVLPSAEDLETDE